MSKIDLILNRVRLDLVKRGDMMSPTDVVDILGIPLIGIIPDDEQVVISTNHGDPLVETMSMAGRAYRNISLRITGEEVPLELTGTVSFWTKVTGIFLKN